MQQRPETPPGADSSPECGISGVGPRQASRISILNSDSRTVVEEGELCHFPCSVLQRTATVVDDSTFVQASLRANGTNGFLYPTVRVLRSVANQKEVFSARSTLLHAPSLLHACCC